MDTVTLYRPVGPAELKLIEASDWREFPPRLPEQPIFAQYHLSCEDKFSNGQFSIVAAPSAAWSWRWHLS
jgi:hypothetical protein